MAIEKPMTDLIHIPNRDAKEGAPKFWQVVESEELKQALIFTIINELRSFQIDKLNDNECRSILAKVQAYATMIDFGDSILSLIGRINQKEEETPSDVEFIYEE